MTRFIFVMLLLISAAFAQEERPLRPFKTDGCTLSPDGTRRNPTLWRSCCVAHDLRLWGGGVEKERVHADNELKACITKKAGATTARIFFTGVRMGRLSPWTIAAMRWGNAWYDRDGYRKLSNEELQRLVDEVAKIDVSTEIRDTYIAELLARIASNEAIVEEDASVDSNIAH